MPEFILSRLAVVRVVLQSGADAALEILALRQQVAVLKRKRPQPVLKPAGQTLLNSPLTLLVPLGRRHRHRQTRNCRRLAPRGILLVLALLIPATRLAAENPR